MAFPMAQSNPPITSAMGIMGHVVIKHLDSEGNILSYQQTDNTIVIGGMDKIRDANISGSASNDFDDMKIGTDGGDISNQGLTDLGFPINKQEAAAESAVIGAVAGVAGAKVTQTATFKITAGDDNKEVREAGLFDGDTDVMLSRVNIPNFFTVFTDDEVELAYTIIYG